MIKRTFLVASILFFLFTACHKEQALPPIVKKSYNYENALKKLRGFNLANAGLTCYSSYYDLFDGENGLNSAPLDPPYCYKEDPTELYYISINNVGSNINFTLRFYGDLNEAVANGEVAYTSTFSFKEVGSQGSTTSPYDEWLSLSTTLNQEYIISCVVTFTDFECVYDKSVEFVIRRGLAPIGGNVPLYITPTDNESFVGNPIPPGKCDSSANAVALIVP